MLPDMALGIDVYRYQTVTDWAAVKRHGVSFVYVKGTDGGGPARVRADDQVNGAKAVGLPVGLYHYAQLSPSPEVQADVLTGEIRRVGASDLSPALDLEAPFVPNAAARQFAYRFLDKLRANGFEIVTLYANTSMLTGIGAATLEIPGLRIWAANYGPNNGLRNPMSYRGRVDIHQYTSVGQVPGITGSVDLNEAITTFLEDSVSVRDVTESWYGPRFRADRNFAQVIHNIEDLGTITNAKLDGVVKALAALSGNPDITPDAIRSYIEAGIAKAAPAITNTIAQAVAADLRPELLTLLGSDNEAQADQFLSKLADRLASGGPRNGAPS
jgi:GH25 family lysozyme M1 (1,4-beta-N-acetylmuramidase)